MRIVVTRPEARAEELSSRLRNAGHEVCCVSLTGVVDLEPFPDPAAFDGVLMTSVNAVARAPFDATWPRVGAVGPATAAALERRGIRVDLVGGGGGRELAEAWGPAQGKRLLWPRAEDAHPALAEHLRAGGAEVVGVAVYRTVALDDPDRSTLAAADVIAFFAPSAVRAFEALDLPTHARFWGHGPTTRAAMAGLGPLIDLDALAAG